jgi:hypothetical protein
MDMGRHLSSFRFLRPFIGVLSLLACYIGLVLVDLNGGGLAAINLLTIRDRDSDSIQEAAVNLTSQGDSSIYNSTHYTVVHNGGVDPSGNRNTSRPSQKQVHPQAKAIIAYSVTITGCGAENMIDGAAVLQYSIHKASIHGSLGGRYNYHMFAFYHPSAKACALPLQDLGYTLVERPVFVNVSAMSSLHLRENIEKGGCCGEKELIKFEAYTLADYPLVVQLDLDTLILKPLDPLFDAMLEPDAHPLDKGLLEDENKTVPVQINAMFTCDYNLVIPTVKTRPVQGGFLLTRPNMTVYDEIRAIVRDDVFSYRYGWGNVTGRFYGDMTFQGLLPYYYTILHPTQHVELNHCIFNQMAENPLVDRSSLRSTMGICMNGKETCEDCRMRTTEDVYFAHFTLCQKPWTCTTFSAMEKRKRICDDFTRLWFQTRSEMEQVWGRAGRGPHEYHTDIFHGYCAQGKATGYSPIAKPYAALSYSNTSAR